MEKTYILTTANIRDLDPELCPSPVELASAATTRGKVPVVPALENQKDLTKLVAILLSTGINRNDDVFLPSEILPVRNTGAHKPVNLEHDPKQIIGHMIRTFATEKNGNRVADTKKPSGKSFDITAEAVIYKFLFPALAAEIKERADSNQLFVSVEVWFTAFDFVVGNQIIKRTSDTASELEPHLKINGGDGVFQGKRLGRVLRNLIIGGIGVVKDPANPESIIKSVSGFETEVVDNIEDYTVSEFEIVDSEPEEQVDVIEVNLNREEIIMNPELIEEMAALAAAIQARSEETETIEDGVVESATASEVDVSETDTIVQAVAAKFESRLKSLEKDNQELKDRAVEAEFKAEATRREAKLREIGVPDAQIETQLTRAFNMTAEGFNAYCDLLVEAVNGILTAKASATATEDTETTETAEGGELESSGAEEASAEEAETEETETVEAETEEEVTAEAETEVAEETETETEEEAAPAPADEAVEIEDEVEIEIEAVDPDLNTETGPSDGEVSLTDKFGDVVQQFLQHKNPNWKKLAIND